MSITLNENGEVLDILSERNEEIKQSVEPFLKTLLKEKRENEERRVPAFKRFGYRLAVQVNSVLRKYGAMTASEVAAIDYSMLEDNFNKYMDLVSYYNQYFEFPANKQDFCAFMRINQRTYSMLENSENDDIRNYMVFINDYFISLGFSGGEVGSFNSKAVLTRLKIQGAGHDLKENKDDNSFAFTVTMSSPSELNAKIANLLGEKPKKG